MAKKTIKLKSYLNIVNEYLAAAAITPGHLIELTSAGKVQVHSTAGGTCAKVFAYEDELQGREIDTAYALGERVHCLHALPGDQILAILADGQTVVIGDFLESAGDGTLQKYVQDSGSGAWTDVSNQIVGRAIEAKDMSGSSAADPSARFAIEII